MKNKFKQIVLIASVAVAGSIWSSCGNNEQPKEEAPKLNAADMFKDDRPAYDAKAIDPAAPVMEIDLKGIGLTLLL